MLAMLVLVMLMLAMSMLAMPVKIHRLPSHSTLQ